MTRTRTAYLHAADIAVSMLQSRALTASWSAPSALAEFGVSGLAGHLAAQILNVTKVLAAEVPDEEPRTLLGHYADAAWVDAALDDDANVRARVGGDELAAGGQEALVEQATAALDRLRGSLPVEPVDGVVHLPWGPWSLRLDDFLVTRMMEIVVHTDDLAVSIGTDTPVFPDDVIEPVIALLSALAMRRHGQPALVRALTRAERAPAAINAF